MDKRIVFGFIGILLIFGVLIAGCVNTPNEPKPEEKTTYIIGIDGAYPPFTYLDAEGNPAGFDVESLQWIAQEKGFTVRIQAVNWADIIPSLQQGKIDMVYSGMTITPEREALVAFTQPYWTVNQAVAVRGNSTITLDDFRSGSVKIGVEQETSAESWLTDNIAGYDEKVAAGDIIRYNSFAMSVMGLQKGEVDAVIFDDISIENYIKGRPLKVIGIIDTGEEYGVAIRKEDTELLRIMNEGLADLKASPKWQELIDKHLVQG